MSDYGTTLRKHRRLAMLRFLKDCDGYSANGSIIRDVVNGVGVTSTTDQITTELAWLKEQGLITLDDLGGLLLATATTRGVEIAQGLASHPDVQRPSPRA
ncbi:VpaChn25_0724 family phage protein [Gemmobacter serpentinus]|uniref:VpaChn25_0724 family phage protein n=1 Tax=Gemmobacter serpentinus TaxID=2652247 RepID=UPI00124E92B8|nr:hypothetical protein [Gemmobacter serpentinus]